MQDLGTLGVESALNPSFAMGINDLGLVVGTATAPDGLYGLRRTAFVCSPDGFMQDLNDLAEPDDGSRLAIATGINNRGQIIAFTSLGGVSRLKLLTPINSVPEPGTLTILAVGLVATTVLRKRTKR